MQQPCERLTGRMGKNIKETHDNAARIQQYLQKQQSAQQGNQDYRAKVTKNMQMAQYLGCGDT